MAHYGGYRLLREKLLRKKELVESLKRSAGEISEDHRMTHMTETRLYIGLNDADTKKQLYETDQYKELLKKICYSYHVPFSVGIEEGGYFHENGEYVEEKSLVLTLIDIDKEDIRRIAQDLCSLFHQESVLITEDVVRGGYYT